MSKLDKNKLYQSLFNQCALNTTDRKAAQGSAIKIWNTLKSKCSTDDELIVAVKSEIEKLKISFSAHQPTLFQSFAKANKNLQKVVAAPRLETSDQQECSTRDIQNEAVPTKTVPSTAKNPKEQRLQEELKRTNESLVTFQQMESTGLMTRDNQVLFKKKKEQHQKIVKEIKRLTTLRLSQKRCRDKKKRNIEKFKDAHPELGAELNLLSTKQTGAGRPRLEQDQPLLLQTIVDIVTQGSSTDPRRRSETLRSCHTLTDLCEELNQMGFKIGRSALYIRLLPKNSATTEGKRHVTTVPVRLIKPENSLHAAHPDGHFASATVKFLKDIANSFGRKSVVALSQDDKARIPLGLVAANKQSPILMHIEYKVTLPDHDWVIAPRHKLIPSVYAGLNFDSNGNLSYSGPTYITIRSGKHDKSSAASHAKDLRTLFHMEEFGSLTKTGAGETKPIVIIFVDGASDENPRFPRVQHYAVELFKLLNLDALFIACHAPKQSAFNPVERRMAPLSRDLAGIILPHDHYGSHLDSQGKTIDTKLEIENFRKAGECLAAVWNENIIDSYVVKAEYIEPVSHEEVRINLDEVWMNTHVRRSQYLFQIIKCDNENCCGSRRTRLKEYLQDFLPAPVLFYQAENGITANVEEDQKGFYGTLSQRLSLDFIVPKLPGLAKIPFDYYCPSVRDTLPEKICCVCGQYFPTKISCSKHAKAVHKLMLTVDQPGFEKQNVPPRNDATEDTVMQVIQDVIKWFKPVFEELA